MPDGLLRGEALFVFLNFELPLVACCETPRNAIKNDKNTKIKN
jgi:hypothetical protein